GCSEEAPIFCPNDGVHFRRCFMTRFRCAVPCVLLMISPTVSATAADSPPETGGKLVAVEYARKLIYHSPQTPGFTSWVGAWTMRDDRLMVCFTQATGPLKDRW